MPVSIRPTNYIGGTQANNLIGAACHADNINRPLNRYLVIHCALARISEQNTQAFIAAFMKFASDWLRYNTGEPAYFISVHENPVDPKTGLGGRHFNLLIHLPEEFQSSFVPMVKSWVKQSGGALRPKVVRQRPIAGHDRTLREHYFENLFRLVKYVLKGADQETCDRINRRHEPQGEVRIKRCTYSQSLRPSLWQFQFDYWPNRDLACRVWPEIAPLLAPRAAAGGRSANGMSPTIATRPIAACVKRAK